MQSCIGESIVALRVTKGAIHLRMRVRVQHRIAPL